MSNDLEAKRQAVRDELEKLNHEYKVEIPKRIAEARTYGDLKENAEYHAARERQGFVQARISQLHAQLYQLKDMNIDEIVADRVGFGSRVSVVDLDSGDRIEFQFVAPDEVDPSAGRISLSSPIGAALQNKQAGEQAEALIPAGKRRYFVEKIVTIHGNKFEVKYPG
ncbi:MAG: transcription elongation factor GreA [Chrysiogenales bacterium]|nr:MAG: transcription elongation factor GreA [Chrysiogenales bacterium]